MTYQYINSDQALAEFCSSIQDCRYCALDTEFIREKTYYPLLALIQLATENAQACIDPLKIKDFSPLLALFNKPSMLKILHSPSQDLELFHYNFNALPGPIFDTQIAAAVLGFANQIGYADLVQRVCGVQLEKKYTRADWSRRPLSEGELDYAMDDVRYLIEIYQKLTDQLKEKDRLSWVEADFARMTDAQNYQVDMTSLWKRLKGVQKLKGIALNHADQLCRWREKRAMEKDRPRRWIMKDEDIVDIARFKPKTEKDLNQIGSLSADYIKKIGAEILQVLAESEQMDSSAYPRHSDYIRLTNEQQAKADCLMAMCRLLTEENEIAISSVVSKKDIDGLVAGERDGKILQGWRNQMLGQHLLRFLDGELSLKCEDGCLEF
jgi:ribonuclease D